MAVKKMEVVICDLCNTDRPAILQRTIDVCERHNRIIDEHMNGNKEFTCSKCGRLFSTKQGLGKHKNAMH